MADIHNTSIYFIAYIIFFAAAWTLYLYELLLIDKEQELNTIIPSLTILFFVLSIICGWFELLTALL